MPCYQLPYHTIPWKMFSKIFFTGSYIYIEASTPRVKGDKAAIKAGPFEANQNYCFTFYYHMFGAHIGQLSVYRTWFNRTNIELLWSRNTSSGNNWQASSLDVKSTKNFYVSTVDGFCISVIILILRTLCYYSGVANSINTGAHIHIFVFTYHKNNRFQKKLIVQNMNI